METRHKYKEVGYTISEILIVLVIAIVIFAAVTLGWSSLSRISKNNARGKDASNVALATREWLSNFSSGLIPSMRGICGTEVTCPFLDGFKFSHYSDQTAVYAWINNVDPCPGPCTGTIVNQDLQSMIVKNSATCSSDGQEFYLNSRNNGKPGDSFSPTKMIVIYSIETSNPNNPLDRCYTL